MSFFRRAREATADLASATKRQTLRGKVELEIKRLESRVSSEKDRIGQALFPMLEDGSLKVDSPEVAQSLATIASLQAEIAQKHEEAAELARSDGGEEAEEPAPDVSAPATPELIEADETRLLASEEATEQATAETPPEDAPPA